MSFDNMGKPIPNARREVAYANARSMGLEFTDAFSVVNGMSEYLERDKPYEAMEVGKKYLDITGVYRMMAHLLVDVASVR